MNTSDKKQKLLLEYLVSSTDTYAICQGIIDPEYFDPSLKNTVRFIKEYYEKYHTTPSPEQIEAETDVALQQREIKADQVSFCTSEIEAFCKHSALERAILSSVDLMNKGNYGEIETKIKDALLISLNKDLGLRYFDDPEERLEQMAAANYVMSTGWKAVDDILFGGISRKEILLISANSGGGKSMTLANLGLNFIERGLNVLYISLELAENVIAQRYDTMITGISRRQWKEYRNEIAVEVKKKGRKTTGTLHIKEMPSGTTANRIKAYLKEFYLQYDFMPDLLILDYLDLMNPNERVDLGNVWIKDKLCSEQLRDIGVEYNLAVATASQLNRSAVGATHHDHSQIAGGISKINTADVYWSIASNETSMAAGEIIFHFQKTRNSDGVGKTVFLKWDQKNLRISDKESPDSLVLNTKANKEKKQSSILDIITT